MDINHRKTVLDDDATLYNRKHDTVTKEDLKNLPFKQKLHYFKDYYAKIVIATVVVLIGVIMILNETIFNRQTCVMAVATLNDCQIVRSEELTEVLNEHFAAEKNDYSNISYYDLSQYNMNMAYVTHTATGGLDIQICSKEEFESSAGRGLLMDLSEFLPENMYEQLSDRILEGRYVEEDYNTGEVTYGDYQPLGIDITDSKLLQEYGAIGEELILCVIVTSPNQENALKAISLFTGIE